MCPTNHSFFPPKLDATKLTKKMQHLVGDSSVWHGDGASIGVSMLNAIGGIMVDGHMEPMPNQAPGGVVANEGVCACTTMLTKPPCMRCLDGENGVAIRDVCMEWDVAKVASSGGVFDVARGYLRVKLGHKRVGKKKQCVYEYAHRVVLNLLDGLDDGHDVVCHTCDNPKCLNPKHMLWGTKGINTKATKLKGKPLHDLYKPLRDRRVKRWDARKAKWNKVRRVGGVCKRRG